MSDANMLQIILSALAGAVSANVIGHYVRNIEQKRARQQVEQRNANVYLSKISEIIATGEALKIYGSVYGPQFDKVLLDYRKAMGKEVEVAVLISVIVSVGLSDSEIPSISSEERES